MQSCLVSFENQQIICKCLGISRQEIIELKILKRVETVRDVMNHSEAGTGCTACHRKIRALLETAEEPTL